MNTNKQKEDEEAWNNLLNFISLKFGNGKMLDLQAILFLIGVNELGQGYRDFSKDEKQNLLHIAICRLLSRHGYYEYVGKDKDGWPHWKTNTELPALKADKQISIMKQASVAYFKESGVVF